MLPSSRFLQLPRELRDTIFSFVTHEVRFVRVISEVDQRAAQFAVQGVPVLDLFLINRQLSAEYTQAPCFRKLHVVVDMKNSWTDIAPEESNETKRKRLKILSRAEFVTIFATQYQLEPFNQIEPLASNLAMISPYISTIRIALKIMENCVIRNGHLGLDGDDPSFVKGMVVPLAPPPDAIIDFPLVQRGEGYRLSCGQWLKCPNPNTPYIVELGDDFLGHFLCQISVYLYTCKKTGIGFWQKQDILEHWREEGISPKMLDEVPEDRVKATARLPFEIRGWKEKRGEDAKKW